MAEEELKKNLKFTYDFQFENGQEQSYIVEVDSKSMEKIVSPEGPCSDWTKLDNEKCSHCPLKSEDVPHCPVAANLDNLVDHFKETKSIWKTKVCVTSEERVYLKETDLQTALFSIFGLVMATSPCPYMEFLKPMARFHLPFSTMDETMVRSTSMYMLKQYYVAKDGGTPDIDLKNLEKLYENLNKVNMGISERIRNLGKGDTQSNAIAILDCFAQVLAMELTSDLKGIRHLVE